jgi:hypothetical protein
MTALNLNASQALTPATSGTYVFSVTRDQIIRQAMLDIGALAEGDSPTAQEISDCANLLNMIVKQWMGQADFAPGLKVWTRQRAALFLGASKYLYNLGLTGDNWAASTTGLAYPQLYGQTQLTTSYAAGTTVLAVGTTSQFNINDYLGIVIGSDIFWTTVAGIGVGTVTIPAPGLSGAANANAYVWNYTVKAPRPFMMISAVLRDIYLNDTPLDFMTVERYEALPTKAAPTNIADPTAVLYESAYSQQQPNGQLYIDVGGAQDVTKHIHCTFLRPVQDFNNPGDAPDYPQNWFAPLVLGLGKRIAPMFRCNWTKTLEDMLVVSLGTAKQADPATTEVYFQPNADMAYGP